jgi:hypothetical protein
MWGKMFKKLPIVYRIIANVSALILIANGCALPTPPDGGPRDSEGPKIIDPSVAMGATSVQVNELSWTFDEYVVLNNPNSNIRTSPPIPGAPVYSLRGKTLKMKWIGPLEANKTYIVQFGNGVRDLHEGNPMREPFWVFATGTRIDSGKISGVVRHPWSGKPVPNAAVVLYPEGAQDSAVFNPPSYGSRSGKDGEFSLPYLADAAYRIFALDDPDGNLHLGTGEKSPIGWMTSSVAPGDTALQLWMGTAQDVADSLKPFRVRPADSAGVLKIQITPQPEGPWVHQLRQGNTVVWQGEGAQAWTLEGLAPGKYSLRSFIDLNGNGQLDAGDWWTLTEAETPIDDPEALEITVGWTVERLWRPGASPSGQTDPGPQGTGSASAPPQGGSGPIRP